MYIKVSVIVGMSGVQGKSILVIVSPCLEACNERKNVRADGIKRPERIEPRLVGLFLILGLKCLKKALGSILLFVVCELACNIAERLVHGRPDTAERVLGNVHIDLISPELVGLRVKPIDVDDILVLLVVDEVAVSVAGVDGALDEAVRGFSDVVGRVVLSAVHVHSCIKVRNECLILTTESIDKLLRIRVLA